MTTTSTDFEALRKRLHQLGLFGLLAQDNTLLSEPWVGSLITIEYDLRDHRGHFTLGPHHPKLGDTLACNSVLPSLHGRPFLGRREDRKSPIFPPNPARRQRPLS